MYCPICGKRLRVLPESNRWTNGKPRFKYACPGVRAKECTFKGVEGVTLDEFVIHSLSSLQEEHSDYYRQLLENRVASMIRTDQSEKEYQETKKAIERLNADIAAQVRNLREADDALKRFIQDDIKELTDELAKREAALRRMEDTQSENQYLIHELNGMKKGCCPLRSLQRAHSLKLCLLWFIRLLTEFILLLMAPNRNARCISKAAPRRIIPTYSAQPGT